MEHDHPLTWRDAEIPVSDRFDDPFFSLENGREETRHVFLNGNDLPQRLKDGFTVAELGFGTGLSFLTLWEAWENTGRCGQIHFHSFEAFPLQRNDLQRALAAFPELKTRSEKLCDMWNVARQSPVDFGAITLNLHIGDARCCLPKWTGQAEAWFLDGFAPAKNPELWEQALLQEVAQHTPQGGTFATYTAAGFVRRALDEAGFDVERVKGFGRKRHMSRGIKR